MLLTVVAFVCCSHRQYPHLGNRVFIKFNFFSKPVHSLSYSIEILYTCKASLSQGTYMYQVWSL